MDYTNMTDAEVREVFYAADANDDYSSFCLAADAKNELNRRRHEVMIERNRAIIYGMDSRESTAAALAARHGVSVSRVYEIYRKFKETLEWM